MSVLFQQECTCIGGKDTNPCLAMNCPLLRGTGWVTAVVDEASMVGLAAGINHQVRLECEEVVVGDGVLLGLLQSLQAHAPVKNLTDILHHKVTFREVMLCLKPPTASASMEGLRVGDLLLAHTLVATAASDWTVGGTALNEEVSVNAVG